MKRCPACQNVFEDQASQCLFDGHQLEDLRGPLPPSQQVDGGRTLESLISAEAPFEIERALRLTSAICDALEELHSTGRIIGALHPKDVVVVANDSAGEQKPEIELRAKEPQAGEAELEVIAPYVSPEVGQRQSRSAASDVYCLGAILYEMLAGYPPHTAGSPAAVIIRQILEHPRPLRDVRPEVSPRLQDVVLRALEKEPLSRPQSAALFKQELESALSPNKTDPTPTRMMTGEGFRGSETGEFLLSPSLGLPASPSVGPEAPLASKPPSRTSRKVLLIAGAVLLAMVILSTFFSSWNSTRVPSMPEAEATPASSPAAQPTVRVEPSPPIEDRVLQVVIIVLLAAGIAVTAFVLVLRHRRMSARGREAPMTSISCVRGHLYSAPHEYCPYCPPPDRGVPAASSASPVEEITLVPPPYRATRDFVVEDKSGSQDSTLAEGQAERPRSARAGGRKCPVCETEYPPPFQFCVKDGALLVEIFQVGPPAFHEVSTVTIKMRCPACEVEYPPSKRFCRVDGHRLVDADAGMGPAEPELEAFVIGQYRCFARLGEGGMGVVYKARHLHLERLSAIKVLLPQTASRPDAVKLFRREAMLASSINHPNSVIIYDFGEVGAKLFYLAMEFIQGRTLADLLQPKGREPQLFPLPSALKILRQIGDALDAAHQAGIVHRDLKPQNVMVVERPNKPDLVKVVDFGVARSLTAPSDYQSVRGMVVGTPRYMSPEQANGEQDIDARSDIFSLGIVAYEMLSGTFPFPTLGRTPIQQVVDRASLSERPPLLGRVRPDLKIPPAVDAALRKALEPDRNRRTPSALKLIEDLEQAALV
jgi:serine/threonine protein kinase